MEEQPALNGKERCCTEQMWNRSLFEWMKIQEQMFTLLSVLVFAKCSLFEKHGCEVHALVIKKHKTSVSS